jgi:hypothetical protein
MHKIILTGGPGGGKTTALPKIKQYFESRPPGEGGYKVFTLPESPTIFFSNGVPRATNPLELATLQTSIISLQLEMEDAFGAVANALKSPYTLLLCDRGALDGYAFMPPADFFSVLLENEWAFGDLLGRYDGIVHLVTAADGAMEHYKTGEGTPRVESAERSIEIDRKLQEVYRKHPNHWVVSNAYPGGFEQKVNVAIWAIERILLGKKAASAGGLHDGVDHCDECRGALREIFGS